MFLFVCVAFTIKVWFQKALCGHNSSPPPPPVPHLEKRRSAKEKEVMEEKGIKLAFEGTIDLSDLVYLGTLVRMGMVLVCVCYVIYTVGHQ